MRRTFIAMAVLVTLIGGLASAQTPRRGGVLRVGLNADPPNMDPHQSIAAVDRQVFQNLYDKLVDVNQDLEIVPMLATSWTITNNGRTYTFRLRPNVVFHDGTPFNAEAVKYNFERMLDPGFGSPRAARWRSSSGLPPSTRSRCRSTWRSPSARSCPCSATAPA